MCTDQHCLFSFWFSGWFSKMQCLSLKSFSFWIGYCIAFNGKWQMSFSFFLARLKVHGWKEIKAWRFGMFFLIYQVIYAVNDLTLLIFEYLCWGVWLSWKGGKCMTICKVFFFMQQMIQLCHKICSCFSICVVWYQGKDWIGREQQSNNLGIYFVLFLIFKVIYAASDLTLETV